MDKEFSHICELLLPDKHRRTECKARLRSLAIIENVIKGGEGQPTERELNRLIKNVKNGQAWDSIFPGIASLKLETEESGLGFYFRISKTEGLPVRIVKEGEASGAPVVIKRVNELGYYSLSITQLACHLGLTAPKTGALVRHFQIQQNQEYFKEIKIGKACFKRYSKKAMDYLREEIPGVNIEEIWRVHRPLYRSHLK